MYGIEVTPEAIGDLRMLRKRERQIVIREVEEQLRYEPTQETRNRKRLRPNQLAEWE
jgi:mRNA-degrading endonuclease RelE of RelBE toxin-antitoxin system